MYNGENPSLFHLIKRSKGRKARIITEILDENGFPQTTASGILNTFVKYQEQKYGPMPLDDQCKDHMVSAGHRKVAGRWDYLSDIPIMMEELQTVVHRGTGSKAPGRYDVCIAFFKGNWNTIKDDMLIMFNQMHIKGNIREHQTHVIVVCTPKTTTPTTPADYRPNTLLKTSYRILARIITNLIQPIRSELIHPSQRVGVQGGGVFEAVGTVRDTIVYAEKTQIPLCILSLDFTEAFDRISNKYPLKLLSSYGFSTELFAFIKNMYDQAYSSIHIHGHATGPTPIHCEV
jgi:hypothetical protein